MLNRLLCWTVWGVVIVTVSAIQAEDSKGRNAPLLSSESRGSRILKITRPFLHIPVKNGEPKQRMRLVVNNQLLDEFDIELAQGIPDFYCFVDLSQLRGKELRVEIDVSGDNSLGLDGLLLADDAPGGAAGYREKYRPQFHFSPRRGWNNDPNGLVYYQGEYHLYFQHNPYGWAWGNMHWGHAVSADLLHWKELPVAVYPKEYGDWAYSGSAFIDWKNRSGFQQGAEPPLVIAYTSTGRGECIAYSNDRGRTFSEFAGNPIIKHDGRDPKVIWHEDTGQWVMVVYEILNEGTPDKKQTIGFYTSPDLKAWTHQSNLDGYFECPELFELPVDGNRENTRWVVYAADNNYTIGHFDGKVFTPEGGRKKGNDGNCLYAAQTYSDIPDSDGRRIEIGWGRVGDQSMPFNQIMTFPTSLSLQTTSNGIRLYKEPVREIAKLHSQSQVWKDAAITPEVNPLEGVRGELLHVEASIAPLDAKTVTLNLRGVPIIYDVAAQMLHCGGETASLPMKDGIIYLEVLVDRLVVELFGNHGAVYMPLGITPDLENKDLVLTVDKGRALAKLLAVHTLMSAW